MRRPSLSLAALAALLATAGGVEPSQSAEPDFPQAAVDYFAAMDDGVPLATNETCGCNTWLTWTAGNEVFWDYLTRRSFGAFDLLKVLDSRNRVRRLSYYGLMNEPGFKPAGAPHQFGLWLDSPDGTRDPYYASTYGEAFSKQAFMRTYGRATGIVGLRLYPNPDFDKAAHAAKMLALLLKLRNELQSLPKDVTDDQATEALKTVVPDLLAVSKCPDLVTDHGHLLGTALADDDKHALIAFLKRI
jgi:hypothetical protein